MLAILTSHPIQYQAPLWRSLANDGRVEFEVWFLTPHAVTPSHDPQFGQTFAWDCDLTADYPNRFVPIAEGWKMNEFRGVKVTSPWEHQFREHGVTTLWVEGWRFAEYWSAIRTARRLGIPVWIRGENNNLAPRTWRTRLIKRPIMRYLFGQVTDFLTIGSANRRYYRYHGISESRFHSAPYAVDNAHWRSEVKKLGSQRNVIRQNFGIPDDAFCILFCGKLIGKKRPLDLVRAAGSIRDSTRPIHLLYVGNGELRAELENALIQLPSQSHSLLGFLNLSEISKAFVAADALALPSDAGETWGLVVNEAMACGLPAIVSDQCGCAEDLVAPVNPSLVFRCGDIPDFSRSIRHLIASPPAAQSIRASVDRHDIRETVDSVVRLFSG